MSRSLRAVKTQWFEHSSLFLDDAENLARILEAVVGDDFSYVFAPADGAMLELYTDEGPRLLDALGGLTTERRDQICRDLDDEDPDAIWALLDNLKYLAPRWREALEDHGGDCSLRIWIDA